jgi:uncharacterized repeat protein (TIGR04138 family)
MLERGARDRAAPTLVVVRPGAPPPFCSMPELAFRDGVMDRIRLREPRFGEPAYLFLLAALEFCQNRLTERRHITGRELTEACRDLALQRYGLLARMVLEHWGITKTADFGDIVFTLIELGLLMSQPTDTRDDFVAVFDFADAFDRDYPWNAAPAA